MKICGPRFVLRGEGRAAVFKARQKLVQKFAGGAGHFVVQVGGSVLVAYGHGQLSDNIAGVRALNHFVQGHAGFGFTVDERPVDGRAAPVAGQKRAVQIEAALWGKSQQVLAEHLAVIERENYIGLQAAHHIHPHRVVGVFGRKGFNAVLGGQFGHGGKKDGFFGVVHMGEYRRDFVAGRPQGFNAGTADIVVSENNSSHITPRTCLVLKI